MGTERKGEREPRVGTFFFFSFPPLYLSLGAPFQTWEEVFPWQQCFVEKCFGEGGCHRSPSSPSSAVARIFTISEFEYSGECESLSWICSGVGSFFSFSSFSRCLTEWRKRVSGTGLGREVSAADMNLALRWQLKYKVWKWMKREDVVRRVRIFANSRPAATENLSLRNELPGYR